MSKVAFIGLGAMGSRMATNLLQAGFKLRVYNRDRAKIGKLDACAVFLQAAGEKAAA